MAFTDVDQQSQQSLGLLAQVLTLAKKHILLVFAFLALLYVAQVIYYTSFHPLRNVPGPFLARFSGSWRNIRYFRSTWHNDILAIHEKYGPVVRIAPNEVSFVDAKALTRLYGHGTSSKKTPWYNVWIHATMQHSFFATQDSALHRALRSRVSSVYSMSSILAMEHFIQEVADKTWSKFKGFSKAGETVDLAEWVTFFTFDVVGQLALGGEIGFVEEGIDIDDIISSLHNAFYMMANMGHMPLQMFWFTNPVSKVLLQKFGGKKLNAFDYFLQWLEERVRYRMVDGLGDKRRDMLQHFIEMKSIQGRPEVTVGDVMIEGVNILGAGADTTSVAILAVLGDLIVHPEVLPRLEDEIDTAYQELGLLEKHRELSYKEATSLPYLCAVIKESMRLHPSIQYQLLRYPPEEGVEVGPYHIPTTVQVGISPRAMNRCKKTFGSDANAFNPSRWLFSNEREEAAVKEMSRLVTTFGMGSRVCVGQNIALVEVHKFVAQFIRKFRIKLANSEKLWSTKTQWISLQREFNVKLEPRHD